jgi:hypothetical protein
MPGWERVYQDPVAALYVRKPVALTPAKLPELRAAQ